MTGNIDKTSGLIIVVTVSVIIAMISAGPIPQDPAYHNFADRRTFFGIPNFLDVISSLLFLIVAISALFLLRNKNIPGGLPELASSYRLFFIGVLLTGLGSSWYHLSPTNSSLFWDRLPMAITFMAFLAIVIGEYYSAKAGRLLLWPLVTAGLLSVVYWHITEQAGRGDLRPYAIVQFLPMLLIPLFVLLRPARLQPAGYLWGLMACYLLAKVLEFHDREIYEMTHMISGHALKHLASAAGIYFFYLALKNRRATTQSISHA